MAKDDPSSLVTNPEIKKVVRRKGNLQIKKADKAMDLVATQYQRLSNWVVKLDINKVWEVHLMINLEDQTGRMMAGKVSTADDAEADTDVESNAESPVAKEDQSGSL